MSYNVLESRTYTLYINSADKLTGTNNNSTFFVDWAQVLPDAYNEYKMIFTFQTSGGYYTDLSGSAIYSTAKVSADFGSRQFSYDTAKRGPSNTIGYISRDQQTATTSSNVLSCFYYQYPAKTMTKPTNNMFSINITNMYSGLPLVNTDRLGNALSDMTPWQACFEFFAIEGSLNNDMRFHNL